MDNAQNNRIATFLADGGYSSVWIYNDGVLKITQDMCTIDFYMDISAKPKVNGLPEVKEIPADELESLLFKVEFDNDEILRRHFYAEYEFLQNPAILCDYKGYTMPRYSPLSDTVRNMIWHDWYKKAKKRGIELTSVACNAELKVAFDVFRAVVPTQYYYPDSLTHIEEYLKERNNWCLDPGLDNFLVDEKGKIIFADIFAGIIDFVYSANDEQETISCCSNEKKLITQRLKP